MFVFLSKTLEVLKWSCFMLWLRKVRVREVEYKPKVVQLTAGHVLEHRSSDDPFNKETLTFFGISIFFYILSDTKPKHESIMIRISPFDAHNSLNDSSILGLTDFPNS